MKWFKFTIYVQLFLGAVVNLFGGISYITGLSYGSGVSEVYSAFPGLHPLNIGIGIACIAIAVFAIVVRMRLAGYKSGSPVLLYIFLAVNIWLTLFYLVAASIIMGTSLVSVSTVTNLATSVILLICDYIYFNKRKALFQK